MKSRLAERLGMLALHGICSLDLGLTHVYGSVTWDGQRRTRDTRKLSFMGSYLGQYAHVIHHATTGCDSFVLYRLNWNIGHNCLRTPVSSQFMHLFVSKTVIPGSFHCGRRSSGPQAGLRHISTAAAQTYFCRHAFHFPRQHRLAPDFCLASRQFQRGNYTKYLPIDTI